MAKLGKGIRHNCSSIKTLYKNANNVLDKIPSQKIKERLVTTLLRNVVSTKEPSQSGEIILSSAAGGSGIPVVMGRTNLRSYKKSQSQPISTEDFLDIEKSLSLSRNKTLALASKLRSATKTRFIVEPGLKKELLERSHQFDDLFSTDEIDVELSNGEITKRPIVFCNNVVNLIDMVKLKRNISNVHRKVGIDGGRGSLKVTLSIQSCQSDNQNNEENNDRKSLNGLTNTKDSSVKKIFLLGLIPAVPELYANVLKLWNILKLNDILDTVATDLKLTNILFGLMSHASSFPCSWCEAPSNQLSVPGNARTIQLIKERHQDWLNSGAIKKDCKRYKNCVKNPIIEKESRDDIEVLAILPPPELHLMMGVVGSIYVALEKELPEIANNWLKSCNVEKDVGRSSQFKGNPSRKLLSKVDVLRSIGGIGALKFVNVLEKFNTVVTSCFGRQLKDNYETSISNFKDAYCDLNISVTPKVHAVFFHVPDFCKMFNAGLGFYSEQAVEGIHFDFDSHWNNFKVRYFFFEI